MTSTVGIRWEVGREEGRGGSGGGGGRGEGGGEGGVAKAEVLEVPEWVEGLKCGDVEWVQGIDRA